MNPAQQHQTKRSETEASATKRTYRQPPNKTAVWLVVMLWPPVALVALALLSAFVTFIATPAGPAAGWVDPINSLIFFGVVLAFTAAVLNFVIGLAFLIKNRG